ncbi:MAG: histidine--tRNA ligase [Deltaproteobacteria bacterium]|nr:MAG: histidine--tRNA ligase [Deltaproteobacteria bacterium]
MTSEKLTSVRGMNDILPPESDAWRQFEDHCRAILHQYGYREVRTPIVEATALFARGVGEATDIVEKEMYTFADRKGRSLTLRPEGTASCVRAYIQHAVHKREPVTRWYYVGPMFRYERMQTGRYRQFWQIGVEVFGIAEPTIDVEIVAMLHRLYSEVGIANTVVINSVGGRADRPVYRERLLAHFGPHRDALCGDCRRRLDKNPLRVLDCKVEACRRIIAGAPSVLDALGDASRGHFDAVRRGLAAVGVPFDVDPRLVRGLDYYTGTVFELITADAALGAQGTIVAGGRYDDLVEDLGGPSTPAIGFALGVERAMLLLGDRGRAGAAIDVFFASAGPAARERALAVADAVRRAGFAADMEHRDVGFKAQFKRAHKLGAQWVVAIGDAEAAAGTVRLKHMESGQEREIAAELVVDALRGEV